LGFFYVNHILLNRSQKTTCHSTHRERVAESINIIINKRLYNVEINL